MARDAQEILAAELEDAVGPEAARRALQAGGGHAPRTPRPILAAAWSSRLLIGVLLVAAVVVGAFLSVLTGSWWLLAGAVTVHAIGTFVVLWFVFRLLADVESPSPTAAAALEARGVKDPDRELNELIARSEQVDDGPVSRLLTEDAGELPDQEANRADATRRQQSAWTPSGDPSRPVRRSDLKRR